MYKKLVLALSMLLALGTVACAQDKKFDDIASKGMVSTSHPLATQVGLKVLKDGGNAIDAAIAASLAIGVVEPNASGIGGAGFAILYVAKEKKTYVVDFRESAPAKATSTSYLYDNGTRIPNKMWLGWYAAAVPGHVAGMEALYNNFGNKKLSWAKLIQPTIDILKPGIVINANNYETIYDTYSRIDTSPTPEFFIKTFLRDDFPIPVGEKYFNPDLVESFELIAKEGAKAFYEGAIATKIADTYKLGGEWITKEDLKNYKVVIREPLKTTYRGKYEIHAVPNPSSGGTTMLEIINILENFDLKKMGYGSADYIHTVIEAQRLAYADRGQYSGDPAFVKVPEKELTSKEFAKERAALIKPDVTMNTALPGQFKPESGSTTSLSVVDKEGNMITITQTVNYFFGSYVAINGAGIIMNDGMDDFSAVPDQANSVAPGKRPRSSMTPVIMFKDGKPFATMGSPGGNSIINIVLSVFIPMADFDMDIQTAIFKPRINNQNGEKTVVTKGYNAKGEYLTGFDEKVLEELEKRGHVFNRTGYTGTVQGAMFLPNGKIHGGSDPSRPGNARGF